MININGKEWSKVRLKDIEKFLLTIEDDETFFVEFKTEDIRTEQLAKEICAFSNSYGGYVFLGVDDSKNIVGCTKWNELRINNVIYNCISPAPKFDIRKFKLENSKRLYIIKVEEGLVPPYVTNTGKIYQRISSSSDPVKDSFVLNAMYNKKEKYVRELENKLYIEPIKGQEINNLCGYIDFGFGIVTRDVGKIYECMDNANYEKIVSILKEEQNDYNITRVGYSICISIGKSTASRGKQSVLIQSGVNNFMEIMADGSFRCRILFVSEPDNNIANIAPIVYIFSLFKEIYSAVFGEKFINNFIEALKYEKLTVLKQFKPKYIVSGEEKYKDMYNEFYNDHVEKYGNNIIMTNNRIPLNSFMKIDKSMFDFYKKKFNPENLYGELFRTGYFNLGYIDEIKMIDNIE